MTLELILNQNFDGAGWRDIVTQTEGNPFHLPDLLLSEPSDTNLLYLLFKVSGVTVGCGVGVIRETRRFKFFRPSHYFHLPTAISLLPLANVHQSDIYRTLAECLRERSCSHLYVGASWGRDFTKESFLAPWLDESFVDFTIDVLRTEDDIFASMRKNHRRNIRIGEKNDLQLTQDTSLSGLLALRSMQIESAERGATRDNPFTIMDEDYYKSAYQHVYATGLGGILFATVAGRRVAGLSYLKYGTTAIEVRSGCSPLGYELNAAYFLKYQLIKHLRTLGVHTLNLSAVPAEAATAGHPQHGLYNFKKGFGGQECNRTSLRISLASLAAKNDKG